VPKSLAVRRCRRGPSRAAASRGTSPPPRPRAPELDPHHPQTPEKPSKTAKTGKLPGDSHENAENSSKSTTNARVRLPAPVVSAGFACAADTRRAVSEALQDADTGKQKKKKLRTDLDLRGNSAVNGVIVHCGRAHDTARVRGEVAAWAGDKTHGHCHSFFFFFFFFSLLFYLT
jgi:hypothetical protein